MGQILYIPHGGGPLPLLGDPAYASLAASLRALNGDVAGCKAILLVTTHWEADRPSLSTASSPGMLYDYYGFPDESYQFRYPAPGAPELAKSVASALAEQDFTAEFDAERGYDHGTFVPMMLIRPEANIPILQMSLLASLDSERHLALGRALAGVLDDDIALIGSGFSFHNLGALTGRMGGDLGKARTLAEDFHVWLDETVCGPGLSTEERGSRLAAWAEAPGARFCHPREEHLLPLHVCFGAAAALGRSGEQMFGEPVKGYQTSGYRWH